MTRTGKLCIFTADSTYYLKSTAKPMLQSAKWDENRFCYSRKFWNQKYLFDLHVFLSGRYNFNKMVKYCLVEFIEDYILYVVSSKSIETINEKLVRVPYKKMGFYEAAPLDFNDNRKLLEN